MIPINIWEDQNGIKTLYGKCVEHVCLRHNITRMELDILLFLANNPCFDTAKDIVEIRFLSKSQVSVSIKLLEQKGFLKKTYANDNKKTAHLVLCEPSAGIISDGRAAQEKFFTVMMKGLSPEEIKTMSQYGNRIRENINDYLKEDTTTCLHF